MKTFKRILSIVLVLVMTATAVPAFVSFTPKAEAVKIFGKTAYYTKDDLKSGYIELGSYPQSQVTDSDLISTLYGKMPPFDTWISYDYYCGDGYCGSMTKDVPMSYTDVEYDGAKYRGVVFTQHRPKYTFYECNDGNSYQDDNGYTPGVYWFKFEPLKWRVLDKETGLIMCENIIDSQAYCNTAYKTEENISGAYGYRYYYYSDAAHAYKQNEYAKSSIRAWLNNDFYNTAFSSIDKTAIATSKLDDFGSACDTSLYEEGKYLYDKIFVLSRTEAFRSSYGFENTSARPEEANWDRAKEAKGTDYAKCQGLEVSNSVSNHSNGNSGWLLRTAAPDSATFYGSEAYIINSSGGMSSPGFLYATSWGVRPCLKINLHTHSYTASEKVGQDATHLSQGYKFCYCICGESMRQVIPKTTEHKYTSSTVEATCTEDGLITYSCPCGHKYTEVIPAGHKYKVTSSVDATCTQAGSITYTCTCGDNYTETIPLLEHNFEGSVCTGCGYDRADDCSCNCHKSGISKFFFNIMLFFQKLFGNNKVCACGKNHY